MNKLLASPLSRRESGFPHFHSETMSGHPTASCLPRQMVCVICLLLPSSPHCPIGSQAENVDSKGSLGQGERRWAPGEKKEAVSQQGWIPVIAKLNWTLLLLRYHLLNKPCWQLRFSPLVSKMKKRGQDGYLFHYNRTASVSLRGVCFPTRLWAPGRWDLDSVSLDIIASRLAWHHVQWVLHEGWLNTCVNEWMDGCTKYTGEL